MKLLHLFVSSAVLLAGRQALASTVIIAPVSEANAMASMPVFSGSGVSQIFISNGTIVINNAGNSGSTDAGPIGSNTTSAWAEVYQPGWVLGANGGIIQISMSASGSADLAKGALSTYVEDTRPPLDAFGGHGRGQPWSRLGDTVQFTNSTGSTLPLQLRYEFQGSVSATDGLAWPLQAGGSTKFQMLAAGDSNQVRVAAGGQPANFTLDAFFNQDGITGFNNGAGFGPVGQFTTSPYGTDIGALVTTTLLIPPGESYLGILAFLELDCLSANVCDFGHAGLVRFGDLPTGLSYTSASGTFLSAVPLPAAFWLMLSGLGIIGAVARRNRRP